MILKKASLLILTVTLLIGHGCKETVSPKGFILDVPVMEVLEQDVPLLSEFAGQTYGESDIEISPRVKGLIESMDFKEGSFVKQGQLLYTIEPNTYQNNVSSAQANLAESNTNYAAAKADFERIDLLVKMNAVSQRELEGSKAKYEAAKQRINSAQAQLRNAQIDLGYCRVTAPIDGIIGISKVRVGDYVAPGPMSSLNTISNTKSVRVRFTLSEQEFLKLYRESKKENSSLQGGNNIQLQLSDGSMYDQTGKYSFADRQVDPTTGSLTLEATFPNDDQLLRPGQFVKVKVAAQIAKKAIVIPQRAVIEMQGIYLVFLLGDSNKVNTQIIEPGPTFKDAYIVADGLKVGDKIAFGGTQQLKNGSVINPKITNWQPGMSIEKPSLTK
jgi:membrane fusion protein (multidrug efflux system)